MPFKQKLAPLFMRLSPLMQPAVTRSYLRGSKIESSSYKSYAILSKVGIYFSDI
jgi:hypothetical protein